MNRDDEESKALIGLSKDKDPDDIFVTDCDRDVPLLYNACVVLEHRCRRLADPFDVDFECCTDARRYE